MHKILALWAVPRSTSTAFEWMMRMRGDMTCFHEPFGEAWYQGEQPLWPRVQADSVRTSGLTLESVWQNLQTTAATESVFIKDFPHYIDHLITDEFLSHFKHSFLIRDPAKTITSMFKHWPDFVLEEVGFIEQRKLFDRLCDLLGQTPPVIDSDDLLEHPYQMTEIYCKSVAIPFMPDALSWEPGERVEVSWWDGGVFHDNLRKSDGLKPQQRKYVDISNTPDKVQKIHELCTPHYEHLYAHRLTL